jgi:eukaryotic-like serine/threonine-protein kinase
MSRIDTLPDGFAKLIGQQALGVGDVIGGRYKLVQSLGNGGMGQVFVAENIAIGMRVAIKLLKPELLANPEFRQRFQNEAQAVAAIEHPNVARFFDLVVGDPTFIVMEYVRGETLADLIKRSGRLPVARATAIARRLCWGLDAAHAAGVVHRDLKPANVLLAPDAEHGETPKLIDFGLAKLAAALGESARLTRTGQIIGTPQYMSPEQISGHKIDGRADVYALGCLLYEMLTGRPPFAGSEDDVQILYKQMHEPPPPLAKFLPDVAPALDTALAKALEKEPGHRYASMRSFAAALAPVSPEPTGMRPAGTSGVREPSGRVIDAARRMIEEGGGAPMAVWVWAVLATVLFFALATIGFLRWHASLLASEAHTLVMVSTQPPGAKVLVDNRVLEETTPTALRGLVPGPHEVVVRKAGYADVQRQVTVGQAGDGERQALELVLPPVTRNLEVATMPAGATVFVDGQMVPGTTPLTVALTEDDFHELRAERSGYETATRSIKPEDQAPSVTMTLTAERMPRGTLIVESQDVAEVWVDGVSTGLTTPTLAFRVSEGEHVVELRAESGERSAPKKIKVTRGQTLRLSMTLQGAGRP